MLVAIRTGQSAHTEPMCLCISTRSPDQDNPLEELLRYGEDVKAGMMDDPSFASFIYSAPLDADPFAEATWWLANPDMDAARLADIRTMALQASRLPSLMPSFRAFTLNQAMPMDDRFIVPVDWDSCNGEAKAEGPCYGGLDLAGGAADLCAFALYWPETKLLKAWAFIPEGRIDAAETTDRGPYRAWAGLGHVVVTPGRALDRIWLGNWLATACEGLDLVTIAADRSMLVDLQQTLDREGITLSISPHGQGFKDLSPSIGASRRWSWTLAYATRPTRSCAGASATPRWRWTLPAIASCRSCAAGGVSTRWSLPSWRLALPNGLPRCLRSIGV